MNRPLFTMMSVAVVLLASCGDDGVVTDSEPKIDHYPDPLATLGEAGQDQAIENLELSYEELNYGEYERLIHESYVFRFDPSEVDVVGAAEFSANEDLESTFHMFSGETGLEPVLNPVTGLPNGEFKVVPSVQSIRLDLTADSSSSWSEVEGGDFKGSWRRIYHVDLTVYYSGDDRVDQVRGAQIFYLAPGTRRGDTSGTLYWQLRGWEDMGIVSRAQVGGETSVPTDAMSLGQLKASF